MERQFLHAYDLDGTLRDGVLIADAIKHGAEEGFIDPSDYADPEEPTLTEIDGFIKSLGQQPKRRFNVLLDRLTDEAPLHTYDWARQRFAERQGMNEHAVVFSLSPDFLVRAFARGIPEIRHARGTYFHTKGNVFSSRTALLHKPTAIKRYIRQHKLAGLEFAASDSDYDQEMLEMAQNATVVNPNASLRQAATEHGWSIVTTDTAHR